MSVDQSDSTAIWKHIRLAAFLDLTLRRLLEWLQHAGPDSPRCHTPSFRDFNNAGSLIVAVAVPYVTHVHGSKSLDLCISRAEDIMDIAALLITAVVLPNASRHQSMEQSQLSIDISEAHVAAEGFEPAQAGSAAGHGGQFATPATASAASPCRAMLTGEGSVPQVSGPPTSKSYYVFCMCTCRNFARTGQLSEVNVSLFTDVLLPSQSLLQQLSPQLLTLLQQLLAPEIGQLPGWRSEPGKVIAVSRNNVIVTTACHRPKVGLHDCFVHIRRMSRCEQTCVSPCCSC